MTNIKNNQFYLEVNSINKIDEYLVINNALIFSKNNSLCEDFLKNVKFYLSKNSISNSENGDFIGYLISGDIELLKNKNKSNKNHGSLENLQSDLLLALRLLSEKLKQFNFDELPIKMYLVGQAALQYWDGYKVSTTKDLDFKQTEPENLFEMKKFCDIIKIIDMEIKQLEEEDINPNEDLIINNDAASQRFPFEINYHEEIIDEDTLILYIGDKESITLNKVYAFFESYFSSNRIRYKDIDFANNWLKSRNITSYGKLINRYPQFQEIQEINSSWERYFNDFIR